ncbi:uncharacterized protein [Lolium perenne]|uniref:uncharacterized protein isoform X8 n=1 Tax=Lolium perenne TaxID=4522 RepID=UPI003A99828C
MASRAVTTEEPGSGIERRMLAVAVAWVGFSFDVPAVAKALWFPRVDLAVTRHWEGLGLEATRFSWKPDGEQGEASTTCPAATISVSGKKQRHRTGGSGALPERDEERGQIASIPGIWEHDVDWKPPPPCRRPGSIYSASATSHHQPFLNLVQPPS